MSTLKQLQSPQLRNSLVSQENPPKVSKMNSDGSEMPDPTPMSLPVGFERPESIQSLIRRLVSDPAIRADLAAYDQETFEEADDFTVEDDVPIHSPYEEQFDPMGILAREAEIRSGAVKDRTPEQKQAAADLLAKAKAAKAPPASPPVTEK